MKKYKVLILTLMSIALISTAKSQNLPRTFEHKIVAGFNLGATAPVPIPAEVRTVSAWWPEFTPQLGYRVIYNISPVVGIGSGIMLNYKGMGVKDRVKYMYTEVYLEEDSKEPLKGYFVGRNKTIAKAAYATIPLFVSLTSTSNPDWSFRLGGYASYLFSGQFRGSVYNGYLRSPDPTGLKTDITTATFNFDNKIRSFDFGLSVGTERRINKRFGIYANLDWGLTDFFHSDFKGVEYGMYNIYFTLGLAYRL